MVGKQSGQMGFGDLEATGRVPEGHFLKKIDSQIDWRASVPASKRRPETAAPPTPAIFHLSLCP